MASRDHECASHGAQMAQANLLNANTCHQTEKKQHDELKEEREVLKTKLQQATTAENEAVRQVAALDSARQAEIADMKTKREAALLEKDRKHKAEISEIKKQHDEKVGYGGCKQADEAVAGSDRRPGGLERPAEGQAQGQAGAGQEGVQGLQGQGLRGCGRLEQEDEGPPAEGLQRPIAARTAQGLYAAKILTHWAFHP